MAFSDCEFCAFFVTDEETGEEFCDINLDEDEYAAFLTNHSERCPYFRNGDEYEVVKHQN